MATLIHLPHSIIALVFYALWTIALVLMVGIERVVLIARGHIKTQDVTPGSPHGNAAYWRMNRAHMNATENLPVFAAIVLAGWIAGQESVLFNQLAMVVLVARIVQSLIHIASGSGLAIGFRFTAFGVQLVSLVWMAILILQTARVL
jgi:uncharacterized MAPEG superfamily protein